MYLLGDTLDLIALSKNWYWTKTFNTFIQKVLRMSRKGCHVLCIAGNHDDILRDWIKEITPFFFGDIVILDEFEYISVKGKKLLLIHGDKFDGAFRTLGWLYWAGDFAYGIAININTLYNKIRKLFGFRYWSLSRYLKLHVKEVMQYLNKFNEIIVRECTVHGYDGVIYGHTHSPSIKIIGDKIVINDGDVCENVTCVVETIDGKFQLIRMTDGLILQEI
jgi:UDP-2,3-diacylglucosamine pyrophosphatase LpxH